MIRNKSQNLTGLAFDASDKVTGDEANISGLVSIDDGAFQPLTNAFVETIAGSGVYHCLLTAEETDGYRLEFILLSDSPGVQVLVSPDNVIFTIPSSNTGVVPSADNVRLGVPVGDGVGNLLLPTPDNVRIRTKYGTKGIEFMGVLECGSDGTNGPAPPVDGNNVMRSPLYIGDAYNTTFQNAFIWNVSFALDIAEFKFFFRGNPENCFDEVDTWDVECDVESLANSVIKLTAEMSSAETEVIPEGEYDWTLVAVNRAQLEAGDPSPDTSVILAGLVEWVH